MCWDKRDRWPLMLNKLKLMAHTSGLFENRVQRLVIWDVSKYLCGSLFEVILRGARAIVQVWGQQPYFPDGWFFRGNGGGRWIILQRLGNIKTPRSRLIRVRRPTTPSVRLNCLPHVSSVSHIPNIGLGLCWTDYTSWSGKCVSWIMSKVSLPLSLSTSYSSLFTQPWPSAPTIEPNYTKLNLL